ncbi:hypothetical protein TRVL_06675 [Trypanosoma vivax]|nr:hypothetical protein TRVL_06675 [Trypanosoma vivax]
MAFGADQGSLAISRALYVSAAKFAGLFKMAARCPRNRAVLHGSSSGSVWLPNFVGTLKSKLCLTAAAASCARAPRFIERAAVPQDCMIFSTLRAPSAASRSQAAIFAITLLSRERSVVAPWASRRPLARLRVRKICSSKMSRFSLRTCRRCVRQKFLFGYKNGLFSARKRCS